LKEEFMVRSLLLGGVAVGLMCAAAALSAAAAPHNPLVTWQGSVTLLSKTAACDAVAVPDFDPGTLATSIYRPQLDAAEPLSALTILLTRGTLIFVRTSGDTQMNGAGNYSGIWVSGRVTGARVIGTYNFLISPTVITATTPFASIIGTITNWAATTGCTVTFRGAYVLRPN
jgi:hypothetical protein